MRTEYYEDGVLVRVEDDGIVYTPQEAQSFDRFTPREFAAALVKAFRDAGVINNAHIATIRDSLIEQLKR